MKIRKKDKVKSTSFNFIFTEIFFFIKRRRHILMTLMSLFALIYQQGNIVGYFCGRATKWEGGGVVKPLTIK